MSGSSGAATVINHNAAGAPPTSERRHCSSELQAGASPHRLLPERLGGEFYLLMMLGCFFLVVYTFSPMTGNTVMSFLGWWFLGAAVITDWLTAPYLGLIWEFRGGFKKVLQISCYYQRSYKCNCQCRCQLIKSLFFCCVITFWWLPKNDIAIVSHWGCSKYIYVQWIDHHSILAVY